MDVLLTNCYSRKNSGDGWLVDLASELLQETGHVDSLAIVAADPESFPEYVAHAAPGWVGAGRSRRMLEAGAAAAGRPPRMREAMAGKSLVAAVGGGYLRAGDRLEAMKAVAGHLSQIKAATDLGLPTVLLPQSIGPLRVAKPEFLDVLSRVNHIYVRDDRSIQELAQLSNVTRIADLAVLRIAESDPSSRREGTGRIGLALRGLDGHRGYEDAVRTLVTSLGRRGMGLVQSKVGAKNNDERFYAALGLPIESTLQHAVRQRAVDVIISVRMHGALEAIHAGIPAIHLSYERKGFGAYEDLQLLPYLHQARAFDADSVCRQADALVNSDAEYWRMILGARDRLRGQRRELLKQLAAYIQS